MSKSYYSLGLMSGTSMDGVDASVIQTDGRSKYKAILDKYFEYPKDIYQNLTTLRDKIIKRADLKKFNKRIKYIEKDITVFHAKVANDIIKKTKVNIDFIGFHGQTIFHSFENKISKQLGDGKLLSALTRKKVVYDFRQNDIKNNGEGAPLTPAFHHLLCKKFKLKNQAYFLNIGGIINITQVQGDIKAPIDAYDMGPGMCLIDKLIRDNLDQRYDKNGKIAKSGRVNKEILKKLQKNLKENRSLISYKEKYYFKKEKVWSDKYSFRQEKYPSLDVKQFDYSIVKELSLKDAAATLTEFTASIITNLGDIERESGSGLDWVLCGGGRKNNFLVQKLKKIIPEIKLIDDYGINGDFVESQAFAYLAIRSYLKLPISFPYTTGCEKACTGGVMVKNF